MPENDNSKVSCRFSYVITLNYVMFPEVKPLIHTEILFQTDNRISEVIFSCHWSEETDITMYLKLQPTSISNILEMVPYTQICDTTATFW
jgi:hypothetical protein